MHEHKIVIPVSFLPGRRLLMMLMSRMFVYVFSWFCFWCFLIGRAGGWRSRFLFSSPFLLFFPTDGIFGLALSIFNISIAVRPGQTGGHTGGSLWNSSQVDRMAAQYPSAFSSYFFLFFYRFSLFLQCTDRLYPSPIYKLRNSVTSTPHACGEFNVTRRRGGDGTFSRLAVHIASPVLRVR